MVIFVFQPDRFCPVLANNLFVAIFCKILGNSGRGDLSFFQKWIGKTELAVILCGLSFVWQHRIVKVTMNFQFWNQIKIPEPLHVALKFF